MTKKKEEPLQLSDSEDEGISNKSDNKGIHFLKEFTDIQQGVQSVEDFLQADISSDSDQSEDEVENMEKEGPLPKFTAEEEKNEIAKLQNDLNALKDVDSEFFEYLKENAAGLLDFNVPNAGGEEKKDEDEDEAMDEVEGDENQKLEAEIKIKKFSAKDLEKLQKEVKKKPLRGFKKLLFAFNNAISNNKKKKDPKEPITPIRLHFTDVDVFGDFMKWMIIEAPK
eukprot:UN25536